MRINITNITTMTANKYIIRMLFVQKLERPRQAVLLQPNLLYNNATNSEQ